MAFQRLAGDGSDKVQTALLANPEIRELAIEANDRLFGEAAERFAVALAAGVTMRLDVAHAIGVIAAASANAASGDDHFRAAREAVIAGYIWRTCELDREVAHARVAGPDSECDTYAAARLRELQASRPDECLTALVADAAAQALEAGDPVHRTSPGGAAFGRRFLGRGTALSRATVPAAARLEVAEHDALFLAGVCLCDAEPALPEASSRERVHVGVTPASPSAA
jgi:hypothetical protein